MNAEPPQHGFDSDDDALRRMADSPGATPDDGAPGSTEAAHRCIPRGMPRMIGQFHVKRMLASGGMGMVYEAVQEHPRRVVALKVMKQGIASRSAMRRFEYESQVLARLRHPGIAQIYEAGTYDDGTGAVPFFAMEYIPNAQPITEYAMARRLSIREKLELFAQVCDAVHHAHQRAIIHRDLKPRNILVNSHGQVKVIDFGVARGTDSDMAAATLQTNIGQLVGTLRYMSPEQCVADPHDIDIRSDVYALGVVFYELLSGEQPYDATGNMALAPSVICNQPPEPLSKADRRLAGDVETIVHTALEKERERRYQSALNLADDIRHYLKNEPITARASSAWRRLKLWARRHPVASAAPPFALLTIVVILLMYARSERDRETAERAVKVANATRSFHLDVLRSVAPGEGGPDVTVRQVLDATAEKIEDGFADEPGVEASVRLTLAESYWALGEYRAALPHAERAVGLRRRELGVESRDTLDAMNVLAVLLDELGGPVEAETLHRETLGMARDALGDEDPLTLDSMNNLAVNLRNQGDLEGAEQLHRERLSILTRVKGENDEDTLMSVANFAVLLLDQGKLDDAEEMARRAWRGRRSVLGENAPETLHSMHVLGSILTKQGKWDEAEGLYTEMLDIARVVFGSGHDYVATIMYALGIVLLDKGDCPAAEPMLREALSRRRDIHGEHSWKTAKTTAHLGECLTKLGKYAEAEGELQAAYRVLALSDRGEAQEWAGKTIERLIALYEAWEKPDDAAIWRERLRSQKGSAEDGSPEERQRG